MATLGSSLLTDAGHRDGEPDPRAPESLRDFKAEIVAQFRANGGCIRSGPPAGAPFWYQSLRTDPDASAEVGTETYRVRATEVSGAETAELYEAQAQAMAVFRQYAARTRRIIPVFVLERLEYRPRRPNHFHRKCTKTRPKLSLSFSTRWYKDLISGCCRNRSTCFLSWPDPLPGMISTNGALILTASSMIARSARSICSPRL